MSSFYNNFGGFVKSKLHSRSGGRWHFCYFIRQDLQDLQDIFVVFPLSGRKGKEKGT